MTLDDIATALRDSRGFAHKRDIADVVSALGLSSGAAGVAQAVAVGDDCAAIDDGAGGHLLFAIEGLVDDFVEAMPWFAGYCGVMVNVSDIYAMGGRPIAVVDALWSKGMHAGADVLAGMDAASRRYGVPIVGGHSNNRSARGQLAVAILGRAQALLTSFDARPGDQLLMAVDLRGAYQEPYPYWNASTQAPAERLRADLELLPALAEAGLCRAAKDISMAGAIGTALMLLECSGVGATIDLDAVPRPGHPRGDSPAGAHARTGPRGAAPTDAHADTGPRGVAPTDAPLLRWLSAFPSFGFILSVDPASTPEVLRRFHERGLACAVIGDVRAGTRLHLARGGDTTLLWDHAEQPFIQARAPREAAHA